VKTTRGDFTRDQVSSYEMADSHKVQTRMSAQARNSKANPSNPRENKRLASKNRKHHLNHPRKEENCR
jgi:hypothetical protein